MTNIGSQAAQINICNTNGFVFDQENESVKKTKLKKRKSI